MKNKFFKGFSIFLIVSLFIFSSIIKTNGQDPSYGENTVNVTLNA